MINLTISGRVGNDAKETEHGCVFSIATTKKGYKKQDGTTSPDQTIWFSVFGRKGLAPYVKKGDSITIYTDFIKADVYEGKATLSCFANDLEFGAKAQAQPQAQQPTQQPAQPENNTPEPPAGQNKDLPF